MEDKDLKYLVCKAMYNLQVSFVLFPRHCQEIDHVIPKPGFFQTIAKFLTQSNYTKINLNKLVTCMQIDNVYYLKTLHKTVELYKILSAILKLRIGLTPSV